MVWPDEAGIGAQPARRAKAASLLIRPWCDQEMTSCACKAQKLRFACAESFRPYDRLVFFFLIHLAVRRLLRVMARGSSVAALEVENAVLRHELAVLRRNGRRRPLRRRDRLLLAAASRVGPGSILRFASSCCAWRVRTRGGVACGSRASCASSACGWARPRSGRSLGAQVSGRLRGEAARRGASSSAPRRTAWWRATYLWRADRVKVWLWSQLIFGSIGWLICGGLIASKCGCGLSSSSAPSVGFREFVRTARAPRLILVRGVFAPAT